MYMRLFKGKKAITGAIGIIIVAIFIAFISKISNKNTSINNFSKTLTDYQKLYFDIANKLEKNEKVNINYLEENIDGDKSNVYDYPSGKYGSTDIITYKNKDKTESLVFIYLRGDKGEQYLKEILYNTNKENGYIGSLILIYEADNSERYQTIIGTKSIDDQNNIMKNIASTLNESMSYKEYYNLSKYIQSNSKIPNSYVKNIDKKLLNIEKAYDWEYTHRISDKNENKGFTIEQVDTEIEYYEGIDIALKAKLQACKKIDGVRTDITLFMESPIDERVEILNSNESGYIEINSRKFKGQDYIVKKIIENNQKSIPINEINEIKTDDIEKLKKYREKHMNT
ncbi:hypothetical protein [Paraclostridium tenue]|uniref:DUF4825 domain-containing protein n=1 Tax=Paraclostridium tenue TaxID=1737 RepID=A0ABP3XHP6_9FIRM